MPHTPTAKQCAFLMLDDIEAFYGGAAGGGKTDALLMAALQYVDVPRYAAILFRRTYTDLALPGALMDRASEWLANTDARWNEKAKTWRFPSGATLTFGYLETEQDKFRYQSSEFQFIGWDELTQFTETQYRYLFSRLRRLKGHDVPLRMRSASNPGGVGHDWVKQRFLVEHRPFIPARIADNPHLDARSYERGLKQLDRTTFLQLREGDWSARAAGAKFNREWFEIVDSAPADCRMVRYWDMAATEAKRGSDPDWTAGVLVGIKDGITYICDVKRLRGTPQANEALVRQTAELDGKAVPVRMEQEPGSSGVKVIDDYRRRVLLGWDFKGIPSTGSKEVRANPLSSQAEAGNVKLVRGPWITALLDEFDAFPDGSHDDQVDACSGAFAFLSGGSADPLLIG
jgi:predicted phage terminase large subunit-like protein